MTKQKIVLIDAGHGFNEVKQLYERPLMELKGNKVEIADKTLTEDNRDHTDNFYREDHMTLLIAMETKKALDELGYKTYCTRSDKMDSTYHLSHTLKEVNAWKKANWNEWKWIQEAGKQYKPNAFVSIHTNAGGGTGISCLYENENPGKLLAKSVSTEVAKAMNLKIRRLNIHRYMILRNIADGNSCLIECGFHDNPKDLIILLDSQKRIEIGQAIARGIDYHLKSNSM